MARPDVIYWPTADDEAIALTQGVDPGDSFIINGNMAANNSVEFLGISRTVSISSTDDLSLNTFTVTGYLNGNLVSEDMFPGPNNETLYTTGVFDTVISVSTDIDATNASVGSGLLGAMHWWLYNPHTTTVGFVAQVEVTGNIKYSFETTLDDVMVDANPVIFTPIVAMTNATTSQYENYDNVTHYSRIEVLDDAVTDDTGALQITFLQQGIT